MRRLKPRNIVQSGVSSSYISVNAVLGSAVSVLRTIAGTPLAPRAPGWLLAMCNHQIWHASNDNAAC
eukprot:11610333-Alexandrium_andersonii.AAC.1